jgi:hypothetical protein
MAHHQGIQVGPARDGSIKVHSNGLADQGQGAGAMHIALDQFGQVFRLVYAGKNFVDTLLDNLML